MAEITINLEEGSSKSVEAPLRRCNVRRAAAKGTEPPRKARISVYITTMTCLFTLTVLARSNEEVVQPWESIRGLTGLLVFLFAGVTACNMFLEWTEGEMKRGRPYITSHYVKASIFRIRLKYTSKNLSFHPYKGNLRGAGRVQDIRQHKWIFYTRFFLTLGETDEKTDFDALFSLKWWKKPEPPVEGQEVVHFATFVSNFLETLDTKLTQLSSNISSSNELDVYIAAVRLWSISPPSDRDGEIRSKWVNFLNEMATFLEDRYKKPDAAKK
ncbi:hypothetical protein Fcan01_26632 [Folsomia candida]|uniref:Uncharacterized protein n=1 Tax=Folsomia candida TaxID=158441 RepID=A0A226D1K7_FOLCA|nr:hypothetical protein Fcan01_26632 [Folsomia candida]